MKFDSFRVDLGWLGFVALLFAIPDPTVFRSSGNQDSPRLKPPQYAGTKMENITPVAEKQPDKKEVGGRRNP
jgi:hypothetical protein